MANEIHKLLTESVYYAEKAHEVLNESPCERSIHSGLYFMSSSQKFLAQAIMAIEKEKENEKVHSDKP